MGESSKFGFSKEVANSLLRHGIKVLRRCHVPVNKRIAEALDLLEVLEDNGYRWQSRILSSWVNRARGGEWPYIPPGEYVDQEDVDLKDNDDLGGWV